MTTTWTDDDPGAYLDAVTPAVRRHDARTLCELMERVTGTRGTFWQRAGES